MGVPGASRIMYDAAYPPSPPDIADVVAGYIGGGTPHIWTEQEWINAGKRWRLPIFTRVPPTSHTPESDAAFCTSWLLHHNVPYGCCLALDFETSIAPDYVRRFDSRIIAAGWRTLLYGSRSTVMQNPQPSGGYWAAHWTNQQHLCNGAIATQYGGDVTLGKPYDLSVVSDSLPLWDLAEDIPEEDMTPDECRVVVRDELARALSLLIGAQANTGYSFKDSTQGPRNVDRGPTLPDIEEQIAAK